MTKGYLKTDEQGARDIRELRQQLRRSDATPETRNPKHESHTIIVELQHTISANDSTQHDAQQVTLINSTWQQVRPVKVRCLTADGITGSVGDPARLIAVKIPKLGYCVQGN